MAEPETRPGQCPVGKVSETLVGCEGEIPPCHEPFRFRGQEPGAGGRLLGGGHTARMPSDFELYQDNTKRLKRNGVCRRKCRSRNFPLSLLNGQNVPWRDPLLPSFLGSGCADYVGNSEFLPFSKGVASRLLALASEAAQGLGPAKE